MLSQLLDEAVPPLGMQTYNPVALEPPVFMKMDGTVQAMVGVELPK